MQYEWYDDMGDLVQYQYQGRWTPKSLIITVADKTGVPLAYHDARFIVARKKALEDLTKDGSLYVRRKGILSLEPYEVRNADRMEAAKEAQQEQKVETETKLAAITPYEWRLIRGLQKQSGDARLSPLMAKFVLDMMAPGEKERFLGRRQIDDPWEAAN